MRRLLPALLLSLLPLAAQVPPGPAQLESRVMVPVADDARLLEEPNLPWDPSLNSNPTRTQKAESLMGRSESASTSRHLLDSMEYANRGVRQDLFTLKPGERIKWQFQGVPPGKMEFLLGIPTLREKDPLWSQVRFVNRLPRQGRQSRMEFENTLKEPYQVVLFIVGRIQLPYKVQIERR